MLSTARATHATVHAPRASRRLSPILVLASLTFVAAIVMSFAARAEARELAAATGASATATGDATLLADDPPTRSVREFGARPNDGRGDTRAIKRAMRACAASGERLYFPAGTYDFTGIIIPSGLHAYGAGKTKTKLRGVLTSRSNVTLEHMQVGRSGRAFRFTNGAGNVMLYGVKFVGGGGSGSATHHGVIRFGWAKRASNVTFERCTIGRNVKGGNGVCLVGNGTSDTTYTDIVWKDCRFYGQRRMAFECIQRADGGNEITTGYSGIDLIGCSFEPTGSVTISYDGSWRCGDSLISGCLIKGAGARKTARYGTGIELNGVTQMTVENTTIRRCRKKMITMLGSSSRDGAIRVAGCTFDTRTRHIRWSPDKYTPQIVMSGVHGATFDGCRFIINRGSQPVYMQHSPGNHFVDNRFVDTRGSKGHELLWITLSSSGNLFEGNYFRTGCSWAAVAIRNGADQNTFTGNTFVRGGKPAFSVSPGLTVIENDNAYE